MAKSKGFGHKFKKEQKRMGVFEPLPEGWYTCQITSTEINKTKAGDGRVLTVIYKVLKGEHKDKEFRDYLTFDHPNEQTVDIAASALASMCDATEIKWPIKDHVQYHKKKLDVRLVVVPGDGQYGPGNEIKQYDGAGLQAKGKAKGKKKGKKEKPF